MKKRRITFPHMGTSWIAIKSMLEALGLEVVVPPPITQRTLSLGTRYAPEFACLPLKINLGNFIEALEQGANTILMAGGWGPCRFGYYAQVQREILREVGYDFDLVVLEAPETGLLSLLRQIKELANQRSWREIVKAICLGWEKIKALDEVERWVQRLRPRVESLPAVEKVYQEALAQIAAASTRGQIEAVLQKTAVNFCSLRADWKRPVLRFGLVGEIYTVLEPFVNLDVERFLGSIGVEVVRVVYLSQWVNEHLFGGFLRVKGGVKEAVKMSSPYLNYFVGGHGRESVGGTVNFAKQGFDGVIQLGPLTCMPEIVAQSVLPLVSEKEGIPVMTLFFDEHSGEAGLISRVEAFVDLVQRRKVGKSNAKNPVKVAQSDGQSIG